MSAVSILLGLVLAITAFVLLGLLLAGWLAAVIAAAIFVVFAVGGTSRTQTTDTTTRREPTWDSESRSSSSQ